MKAWGLTDKGKLRPLNEDSIFVGENIFIVADGMGGHQAGEIASKMAVEQIKEHLQNHLLSIENEEQIIQMMKRAILDSNTSINKYAIEHEHCRGMGTTIVVCLLILGRAFIANIGDSRAYLIRQNEIVQITKDHSLVHEMLERGQISKEEAKNHPQKNFITRAMGTDHTVEIDFYEFFMEKDDILLLCSDGLSSVLEDNTILELIMQSDISELTVQKLVQKANELGGPDNISIVLIYEDIK